MEVSVFTEVFVLQKCQSVIIYGAIHKERFHCKYNMINVNILLKVRCSCGARAKPVLPCFRITT